MKMVSFLQKCKFRCFSSFNSCSFKFFSGGFYYIFLSQTYIIMNTTSPLVSSFTSFADPKDYVKCNLARVSSHAVLARKDAPIADYQALLKKADSMLGEKTTNPVKLYDGVLFSKGCIGIDEVNGNRQNYAKYLDTAYINDVSAFDTCGKWRLCS